MFQPDDRFFWEPSFHEYLNGCLFFRGMANQLRLLDERLRRVEARNRAIEDASHQQVTDPTANEEWWHFLVHFFGSEEALFERLRVNREVFDDALAFVAEVVPSVRGRRGWIHSNREKLLFLLVFMSQGVEVLEVLVSQRIKTREHVTETVKAVAKLFYDNIMRGAVRFYNDIDEEAPDVALIVDCTVCRIRRPKRPFDEAKTFFSGKHFIYALKKEVCVNLRSGTAALISKSYPGSVHDITILRDHAAELNRLLDGRGLLADLGYRGARRDVPTIIVCDQTVPRLRAKRVLVECFFGRLKVLWSIFSTTWRLGEDCFDLFFNIACAFTNLDILHRPLRESDYAFNEGILRSILLEHEDKERRQRRANIQYRERRRARLDFPNPEEL